MRLVESVNLKIEEASLTGESVPVEKNAAASCWRRTSRSATAGTRAFMSTLVTYGRGKGLVTGTGMNTQIGLIAEMIQSYEDEDTPLQQKLEQLGKVAGHGLPRHLRLRLHLRPAPRHEAHGHLRRSGSSTTCRAEQKDIINLFMTAVSLAIAAVPEGLPAIVTICLALGMQQMVKRHALIRKLPAVETLGCATVICSDKTGTLTQNEMTVVQGWAGGKRFRVTGEGYSPDRAVFRGRQAVRPARPTPDATVLLHGGAAVQ